MTTHTVESTADTVRSGYLDPAAQPVASIAPGDTVRYPNTWTHWGNEAKLGMSFADREPPRHRYPNGPHSMLGPVEVSGAEPGDVIECSITSLRTIAWGWNSFALGVGALPHDFAEPYVHYFTFDDARTTAEFTHGIRLAMAPFLGVVAVLCVRFVPMAAPWLLACRDSAIRVLSKTARPAPGAARILSYVV
jgi:acetamidase/formamidase